MPESKNLSWRSRTARPGCALVRSQRNLLVMLMWLSSLVASVAVHAQHTPFPPPAMQNAPTTDAAIAALNAGRPEYSSHLELDVPEVAVPGTINIAARSDIPGTTKLVVLRGGTGLPPVSGPPGAAGAKLTNILLAAERVSPGAPARLTATAEVGSRQWITLLAQAQGRWFMAVREIKIGRPVGGLLP